MALTSQPHRSDADPNASGSSPSEAPALAPHHNDDHDFNHNHHFHLRAELRHPHHLHNPHRRLHSDSPTPHARSPSPAPSLSPSPSPSPFSKPSLSEYDDESRDHNLFKRQPVVIIQTVSVVHYIDGSGAVTAVSTLDSLLDSRNPDATASILLETEPAVTHDGVSALAEPLPTVSFSDDILPDLLDDPASTTPTAELEPEVTSSHDLSASLETLTPAPFTSSSESAFPTLSTGIFNASSSYHPSLFKNSTAVYFSNHTRTAFKAKTATLTSTRTKSTSSTSTRLSSVTPDATSFLDVPVGGNSGAAEGIIPASIDSEHDSDSHSEPGLTPETRNALVGGVVGSIAGIALLALMVLYYIKWRKQHGKGLLLLGDGDSTARGKGPFYGTTLPFINGGGSSGNAEKDETGVQQRTSVWAIPTALAKLTGRRAIEAPPAEPEPQEKGFYRVSGKKLISVLESGGDGYSDPHESVGSASSLYRESRATFLGDEPQAPLKLGSPMRPVSGIPVFRSGPQRVAVQESTALPPGHRPSAYPTALAVVPEAQRASISVTRDGFRVSRFQEGE